MDRLIAKRKMLYELLEACNGKLEAEPDNVDVLTMRGLILTGIDNYSKAIEDLNKVIEMDPEDDTAYYLRSDCYLSMKDYNLAKQDFQRALKWQEKDNHPKFFSLHPEDKIKNAEISLDNEIEHMRQVVEAEKKKIIFSFKIDSNLFFD